ncbi:MAG: RNA polymerase sigma factor [Bacillota bacterium]|jgi:RNA polymerase sigma-70 factor (ECF subfamily)|nr:RNA polymerase sigma factor [Candidatus Fermentithermobacillaceae bacterium]
MSGPRREDKGLALVRAIPNSECAMREFFEEFGPQIFHYALTILGDTHAAQEVVQETMIGVWRGASRFTASSSVSTWVYSICHNKIVDYIRRESRHVRRASGADLSASAVTFENEPCGTWSYIDPGGDSMEFWETFRRLPNGQREVILLFYDAGFSVAEVAEILEIPAGTVRSRLHAGKQRLRVLLKGGSL